MKFRPCIDIHNGKVKQIVGGSLMDTGNRATENFVAQQTAAYFAGLYQSKKLVGGHIILLNPVSSEFYEQTKHQAMEEYLEAGASHVIVTSYVFKDGVLHYERLRKMEQAVSKKHLVLDLSCRKRDGSYYIVTDRWQKYTDVVLNEQTIAELSSHCDELLVEEEVASMLGKYCDIPVTYAGGVHTYEDLQLLKKLGRGKVDVTIGSALDLFGGTMSFEKVIEDCK